MKSARLKQNANVLGIIEYGSGGCGQGADTDLCVVVTDRPGGLESVHFWLDCGPVDLNVRTLEELKTGGVAPGFDDVLRGGRILYERAPGTLVDLPADGSSGPLSPGLGSLVRCCSSRSREKGYTQRTRGGINSLL